MLSMYEPLVLPLCLHINTPWGENVSGLKSTASVRAFVGASKEVVSTWARV
jgi:hypothetical protein